MQLTAHAGWQLFYISPVSSDLLNLQLDRVANVRAIIFVSR
jgi:hypothetical protein